MVAISSRLISDELISQRLLKVTEETAHRIYSFNIMLLCSALASATTLEPSSRCSLVRCASVSIRSVFGSWGPLHKVYPPIMLHLRRQEWPNASYKQRSSSRVEYRLKRQALGTNLVNTSFLENLSRMVVHL